MKKQIFIGVAISVLLLVAGCSSPGMVEVDNGTYENITVEMLNKMMNERSESFLLINTHIPFEGDIPDTDLSIPYNKILDNLDKLPEDKDAEIVLYCRTDPMSVQAAEYLVAEGYTNVKNLVGGFDAWEDAGYPLEGVRE